MGQSDLSEKSLEFFPDVFADIINALLYQGEQIVCAENLQAAPTETLYKSKCGNLRNQFHDVSKYDMQDGKIKVQYTLENETSIKSKTVLRKAGYEGAVYREQYDGGNIFPFISVLLYWGKRPWKAPKSLEQLWGQSEVWEQNKKYIDNIQLHIYEMAHLPKEVRNRFHSDMRIIVDYLAEKENYEPSDQKIIHLEAVLQMLNALTGDERYEKIFRGLQEEEIKKGGITMCELLDKYENRGIKRGENKMALLTQTLLGLNRITDLTKAVENEEYRDKLYEEFKIA